MSIVRLSARFDTAHIVPTSLRERRHDNARRFLTVILALTLAVSACAPTPPSVSEATPSPTPALSVTEGETPIPEPTATLTLAPTAASAGAFPDPQNYRWVEVFSGLDKPVDITHAGDGSGRLFIVEKPGIIRVAQDGTLLDTPFIDITDRVRDNSSEQGLLGLAFHPKYEENGYLYVNYIDSNADTVIARFQVTGDPNIADPASEKKLLGVDQPFNNHNGGSLAFGPDGYLYIALGDGGSANDPYGNGQSTNTMLGKILRIDVDHGDPYAIPADNPFTGGGGSAEIWAYGLRNPWRISFDSATGDFYTGDVGQSQWEEIDYLPAGSAGGANFGWDAMEGNHPFEGSDSSAFVAPVAEYSHNEGGCSVTGGYVYRGAALPEWTGVYFYGDYCSGKVWGLMKNDSGWQSMDLFATETNISTFGVDQNREIYLASYGGKIYRLEK